MADVTIKLGEYERMKAMIERYRCALEDIERGEVMTFGRHPKGTMAELQEAASQALNYYR